jgi:hypothetical protein
MGYYEAEKVRLHRLAASTEALAQANARLRESVGRLKTIPPKPPVCGQCGKPRRPFAVDALCEGCSK